MIKMYWYIDNAEIFAVYYKTLQLFVISTNRDGQKGVIVYKI